MLRSRGALVADERRHGKRGQAGAQQAGHGVDDDVELLAAQQRVNLQGCIAKRRVTLKAATDQRSTEGHL